MIKTRTRRLRRTVPTVVSLLALTVAGAALAQAQEAPTQGTPTQAAPSPTAATPAAAPPATGQVVPLRAGIHPTYTRLVFDWPRAVPYRVEREGDRVTIRFTEAGRVDLAPARRINPTRASDFADVGGDGGMAIAFTIRPGAVLRDFRSGPRLVIDILDPSAQQAQAQTQPAPAQPTPAQPTPAQPTPAQSAAAQSAATQSAATQAPPANQPGAARPGSAAEGDPLFRLPGRGSGAPGVQEAARAAAAQAAAIPAPATPASRAPAPQPQSKSSQAQGGTAAPPAPRGSLPPQPAPAAPIPATPTPTVQAPAAQPSTAQAPTAQAPIPAAPPAAAAAAATAQPGPAAPGAEASAAPPPAEIKVALSPGGPASAVAFERGGWFYVLFDRPVEGLPDEAARGGFTGPIEALTVVEGEAGGYRMAMPPVAIPSLERDGAVWRVVMTTGGARNAPMEPPVRPDPAFALGPRLVVEAMEAETVIPFTDPVVGDRLFLVPLPEPGQGMAAPRRFREAELLETAQGLAIRPLHEGLTVRAVRDGVDLSVPGGLKLSPAEDVEVAQPPPPPPEPDSLFDYRAWGQVAANRYVPQRQALWQAVADAPPAQRDRARLNLARFYVANGFGPEAYGVLDLLQESQPDVDRRPEFQAVRGVARALDRDWAGAMEDLSQPGVRGETDAQLWRAFAASNAGDHATAHGLFRTHADALTAYPEPFFTRMALTAIDSALAEGDGETAAQWMDRLVRKGAHEGPLAAHVQYRRGRVQDVQGDTDRAEKTFAELTASRDRLHRTLATRDLIELRLRTGKITPQEAAEEFEKLRFAWRGDALELAIQRRLGELHAEAKNYAQAFDTMRRTISLFPGDPQAREIADRMTEIFTTLFVTDGAAHLSPLEALSLYEQYRELTPPGEAGDLIIRRLAERLVEIDLLDRAAELLDQQVQFRLTGEEKSRVGARLAAIRLLDNRPEEAIAALDKSDQPALPEALQEERRLLRARALFQTGQGAQAVALLADDQSRPAKLLRIDIAWRDKQWAAAAAALDSVIGPPPSGDAPMPEETARLVVSRAVALSLAKDDAGLGQLRDRFGPAMDKTGEARIFAVLTRPNEAMGLVDVNTIQSRMAEIDMFKSFLDSYRERQPSGPPAGDPAAVQPAEQPAAPPATN
ncbi:MAG: hypothetical protein RLY86_3562 [Pseudomonadota bacterium]|jgi:tetratricopeptide (TPR) repeat protein